MNELALFAGAGGGILGGKLLGWNTIGAVEIEEYPRKILLQRQRDGILGKFPIWNDITTFDGRPWEGLVDIISGGFPCQDISAAGKGAGIEGERSGLWGEMSRVVDEIRPRFVFVENSPMLTSRGLGTVLGDLAKMGYNARWCVLGADDAGARHRRKRIWILAYTKHSGRDKTKKTGPNNGIQPESKAWQDLCINESERGSRIWKTKNLANPNKMRELQQERIEQNKRGRIVNSSNITYWESDPAEIPDADKLNGIYGRYGTGEDSRKQREEEGIQRSGERPTEPEMGRVAHGVAKRVDRLKAIGNGQVPAVAAIAFTILSEGLI